MALQFVLLSPILLSYREKYVIKKNVLGDISKEATSSFFALVEIVNFQQSPAQFCCVEPTVGNMLANFA